MVDLYETLGIKRTASQDEIRKAYREKAKKCHPDLNPNNKKAEEEFKSISNAYDILKDDEKRAAYDQGGYSVFEQNQGHNPRGNPFGNGFGGFGGSGFSSSGPNVNVNDIINDIFMRQGHPRQTVYQNQHINLSFPITLEDAFNGKESDVSFSFKTKGKQTFRLQVPPGIEHGMRIRYAGKGDDSLKGIPPGDLFVTIEILPHAQFTRVDHFTLLTRLNVDYLDATLGCQKELTTIDGSTIRLDVPAEVTPGTLLRASGKGMRDERGNRGDLLVELILVPPVLTESQRHLLGRIRQKRG